MNPAHPLDQHTLYAIPKGDEEEGGEQWSADEEGYEAVIAEDSTTIAWLKLRFGGQRLTKTLDIEELWQHASQPPEPPERRDITPPK